MNQSLRWPKRRQFNELNLQRAIYKGKTKVWTENQNKLKDISVRYVHVLKARPVSTENWWSDLMNFANSRKLRHGEGLSLAAIDRSSTWCRTLKFLKLLKSADVARAPMHKKSPRVAGCT